MMLKPTCFGLHLLRITPREVTGSDSCGISLLKSLHHPPAQTLTPTFIFSLLKDLIVWSVWQQECALSLDCADVQCVKCVGGLIDTARPYLVSCAFAQIPGGRMEESEVLKGIMLNKDVVHPKMRR